MGMDPISIAMLAASGFQAYQSYEAGKESQAAYNESAAEISRQTAYQQRMALEEMKEVGREGRSAESQAVAAAGKSGLRVAGSVVTLTQAIAQKVERRKAMIGFQFNEEARRGAFQVDQYRKAGRAAKKAGGIEAFGSLLTGGLQVANRQSKLPRGSSPLSNQAKATFLKY
jgi:hypothetical protein